MPDETTFELASIQFGAEPVAVFRFGYERFELRARLGSGNLEHAIAAADDGNRCPNPGPLPRNSRSY